MNKDNIKHLVFNICRRRTIVDYLERKGHHPVRTMSCGRMLYRCPMPDHKETKPSFVVYPNERYQTFYCFGCQSKVNLIDLVAGVEQISWKASLDKLAEGIDLSSLENIQFTVEEYQRLFQPQKEDVADAMMAISSMCRGFLDGVEWDTEETKRIDHLYGMLDSALMDYDFESVEEVPNYLPELLASRREKYEEIKAIRRMEMPAYPLEL